MKLGRFGIRRTGLACAVLLISAGGSLAGCWNQQYYSWPGGSVTVSGPVDPKETASVRVFETRAEQPAIGGRDAGEILAEALKESLEDAGVFERVEVISRDARPESGLVIEGSIDAIREQGILWRLTGARTKVLASGTLTTADGSELLAFERTRESRTAGFEDDLVEDILHWIARDVAVFVEDVVYNGNPPREEESAGSS